VFTYVYSFSIPAINNIIMEKYPRPKNKNKGIPVKGRGDP
jgi:hypothetical protein